MRTLLQIAELGNFKCLMGDCPDTCCKGWEIPVDSRTYNLWRDSSKTKGYLSKLRVVHEGNSHSTCFAKIKLDEKLSCSFLSADKLCTIHSNLGEDFLGHTCKSYPKELNTFWGMLERSMALSCPEVANIVLNRTKPLNLEYVEEDLEPWIFREIAEPDIAFGPELIVKLYEVRTLCLSTAQDRTRSIRERLITLDNIVKKANKPPSEICKLDQLAQDIYFEEIKKQLNNSDLEESTLNSAGALLSIFKPYVKENSFLKPLVEAPIITGKDSIHSILLEHILFLLLFRSLFPFSSTNAIISLNETKNILVLIATLLDNQVNLEKHRPINIEDKIVLIQKTMRILDHYEDLQEKLKAYNL